ncbi:MAG: NADH-quinone oxidoreductase subunit D [Prevotellaceae bacterium]|jgi:NADH-quinone oxidoreductase subunit C/D|nr:NADH-quinone oxidoreductase subunit D [Prevotellaceae bacterium]
MNRIEEKISALGYAQTEYRENMLTVSVPKDKAYETAAMLRNEESFDFLFDMAGMDYGDSLGVIYYLSQSSSPQNMLALKTGVSEREKPELFSVHDLWDSANVYEREVYDFFGIRFINHPDMRRIFLRADWKGYPLRKDYNADPAVNPVPLENELLEDMETAPSISMIMGEETETVHKLFDRNEYIINFGPQHPATHGVLHLRISLDGEIISKIDPNFGYIHRGIEKMCETYTYPKILHLTDRLDYLSGTVNRHAVCLCCEKALALEIPQRAVYVRTIIDELTRIASHLIGWGSMCMDMGAVTAFMYGLRDREKIMDIFEETSGGRLMVNYNVIGGIADDIHPDFCRKVKEFIPYMRKMLKEHHLLFTGNPIARGRMNGIGYMSREKAISLGATGPSGRASGWHNDIRKIEPYAAYAKVDFEEILHEGGMTFDRYVIRLEEIEQSLRIIEQLIDNIPEGAYKEKTKAIIRLPEGEFFQRVENARGQFGVYINSKGDKSPYRVKFRSPSLVLVGALKAIATAPRTKVADLIMLGGSLDYVIPCIDR